MEWVPLSLSTRRQHGCREDMPREEQHDGTQVPEPAAVWISCGSGRGCEEARDMRGGDGLQTDRGKMETVTGYGMGVRSRTRLTVQGVRGQEVKDQEALVSRWVTL